MRSWQFTDKIKNKLVKEDIRLYVAQGKHKGKFATLLADTMVWDSKIEVIVDGGDGFSIGIPYKDLEFLDEHGQPAPEEVTDMTGRVIGVGNWIAYSVSAGDSSHALEIAEIESISLVGTIVAKRVMHNGDKVDQNARWPGPTRKLNNPNRTIKLPVDRAILAKWIMMDFEGIAE